MSLAAAIALLAGLATASVAPLGVLMHEEARVDAGAEIRLAEVAALAGPQASRAAEVVIANAPPPGGVLALSPERIARALVREGFARESLRIEGARQVRVEGVGVELEAARLEEAIRSALEEAEPGAKVELVSLRAPSQLRLPPGQVSVRAQVPHGGLRAGQQRVPVRIEAEGIRPRRVLVAVELRVSGPQLRLVRDVGRGEPIVASDVELVSGPWPERKHPLSDPSLLLDASARRDLGAGELLEERDLHRRAAVEPGEPVVALYRAGAVTLTLDTIARGRADVGETVPVTKADGRGLVRARVVARGRVEILGSEPFEESR